jgi:predicted extracellular nuclease
MSSSFYVVVSLFFLAIPSSLAESIAQINGNRFVSPLRDQAVYNVTGLVTAAGPKGFWLRSEEPDDDPRTSESIYIYTNGTVTATVGDVVSIDGRVAEFRPSESPTSLLLTEIVQPVIADTVSTGNDVLPLTIGSDIPFPPTKQYTSLDNGDIFSLPNDQSRTSVGNPVLAPRRYGLDYWESICAELVTIPNPIAIGKPTRFGEIWVRGAAWSTTNRNKRGGLTLTRADANPEAILIGRPLDGTRNPNELLLGDELATITGVVTYEFGFYRILPLTALNITTARAPAPAPAALTSSGTCSSIVIGSYNVENLFPTAPNLGLIATQIVDYLHSPPLLMVQEIQDNNGRTNDAVVSANVTLSALTSTIVSSGGPQYSSVVIDPVDDQDGGAPGGNIRVAYLYNPSILSLVNPNPGSPTTAASVSSSRSGPQLNFNPVRITPSNPAWEESRKPLVAHWQFNSSPNSTFFTVNVHMTSKIGGSSLQGDPRPPINAGVDKRGNQNAQIAQFVQSILNINHQAKIIVAGDFNEFSFAPPLLSFLTNSGLREADDVAGVAKNERYTYLFNGASQQLDHMFLSTGITGRRRAEVEVEHVHLNTWVSTGAAQASDHDPTLVRMNLC